MSEAKKLVVEVTSVNVKRIDLKAYGVEKARCQVLLKVGGVEKRTTIQPGLDPVWYVRLWRGKNTAGTQCDACDAMILVGK